MADNVTATVNVAWTYDRKYEKGETVTIPKSVYDDLMARWPEMFTVAATKPAKPE